MEVELEHMLHLVDFVVVGLEDLKEDIDWAVDHKGVVGQVVADKVVADWVFVDQVVAGQVVVD